MDGIDGGGNLLPPADAAFEEEAVLFDGDIRGLAGKAVAEGGGLKFTVGSGIREEDVYRVCVAAPH